MLPFIPFPSVCGDDLKVYKYTMDCYRDALISFGAVTVECGDVRMFTPLGLNLLASLIHNLHLQGREIVFIPPRRHCNTWQIRGSSMSFSSPAHETN
jgi:hypothetical protein